jgi:hypothetical protein
MPLQLEQRVSQRANALFRRHSVTGPIVTEIPRLRSGLDIGRAMARLQFHKCNRGVGLYSVCASRDTADAVRPWRDFLILPRRRTSGHIGTCCIGIAVDRNRDRCNVAS